MKTQTCTFITGALTGLALTFVAQDYIKEDDAHHAGNN